MSYRHILATSVLATASLASLPLLSTAAVPRPTEDSEATLPPEEAIDPRRPVGSVAPQIPIGPLGPVGPVDVPVAVRITDFTVTTDSVVAIATVRHSAGAQRVTVRWGDGAESTVDGSPAGTLVADGQLLDGEVVLQHAYTPPADHGQMTHYATASVEDANGSTDVEVLQVLVTPRFDVIQYAASFAPLEHCDSFAEEYTEWDIEQAVSGQDDVATWRQDRLTNPSITPGDTELRRLEGSAVHRVMTATDPHVYVNYKIQEIDPLVDDDAGDMALSLSPATESRSVHLTSGPTDDCETEIRADVEVRVVRPGLLPGSSAGGVGVATPGD